MKVLYDISVLGLGQAYATARTGVYRVIENVAEELVKRKDCEIIFCNADHLAIMDHTLAYVKQKKIFADVPFSLASNFHGLNTLHKKRHALIENVMQSDASAIKKLPTKLKIRGLWLQEKLYTSFTNNGYLIHPNDLDAASIYHSPFYPVPKQVQVANKKPVFITSYDLIPILCPQFAQPDVVRLIKNVLNSITPETWVLCISEATRNDLLNYMGSRIDPKKILVTELAASSTFYKSIDRIINEEVKKKYGIPNAPYILSLCTLEPRKNIDQAIRAFVKMVQQEGIQDLNLVLVGTKGWMFDKIFEEIKASAVIRSRIIITGFVADEDLAALYTEALMFVYPSFYEGFGLPPLEAMQCGTPVITSNTSSLPEVVGDAGLMVSPTDLDALCETMLSLYKKPALRLELSSRSIERAKKFSWERCAQETVDAYKASLV